MSVTLVTAYYRFKSKHSYENYLTWIKNFLSSVKANLIIFTEENMKNIIQPLVKNSKVHFIIKEFKDLEILKKYDNHIWENQYKIDNPAKHANRTKECYIIWNSKFNFLKEAIKINPFESDKFVWNDIGSLRESRNLNNYPLYHKVSKEKLDIVLLNKFKSNQYKKLIYFRDNIYFSGAIFGGGKDVILELCNKFYDLLENYIKNGQFIGCDQQIISSLYLLNKDKFNTIFTKDWFYIYEHYK